MFDNPLPLLLPEAFIKAYPDMFAIHTAAACCGLIILFISIGMTAWLFWEHGIRPPSDQNHLLALHQVILSFLWAFGFLVLGLYLIPVVLATVGVVGYKQSIR